MNIYSIALFLHVVGVLVLFAALAIEWVGLRQIRSSAHPEQTRAWLGLITNATRIGFPSMFVTVVTGIYMMVTVWKWTPWLATTIGALILLIVLARAAAPRLKALGQSLDVVNDPLLWISVQTRTAIALGIVFLKITKPNVAGSLVTIGVAIVLGIASALPVTRRQRSDVASSD